MRRVPFVALVVVATLLAGAGRAGAFQTASALTDAADALRSQPVYVAPDAERAIDEAAAADLAAQVAASGHAMFLAVLPASAADATGGDVDAVPAALAEETGLAGTYGVVVGDSFRAVGPGNAGELATAAFQASGAEGTEAVLADFVGRVAASQGTGSGDGGLVPGPGGTTATDPGAATDEGGEGGGVSNLGLLGLLAAGGGGLFLWSRSRRRRQEAEHQVEIDADRQLLLAELSVLGDDVMGLEPQVTLHPEARPDYDAAVSRFRAAHAALDYARDDVDLVRVERVIIEGQYAMARARATVEGREAPAPPPELTRRGRHDEPALDLDEYGQPVYVGYGTPFYGGGWFGGGGGVFSGLLLGSMLSPFGWGGMWGGGGDVYVDNDGGGWGDGGGGFGGDVGGGDWGGGFGGDVGGGDWG